MADYKNYDTDELKESFYYNGNDLGAQYSREATLFRLWSPSAVKASVLLYDKGYKSKPYDKIKMNRDVQGTWIAEVKEDLHGVFYTYEIEFSGNKKEEAVDLYAKACGVNGERGMVVDLKRTDPEGWEDDVRPTLASSCDSIIYETHVRDITIHKSANVSHPGKFLGLAQHGTRSPEGLTTGLDHLVELGITHVHLLPVYDFGSIDEGRLDLPQYNWGYDPVNYNCLEGSYATNPFDGEVRIKEFKTLVNELHKSNIRVVMDVVYNHTLENEQSNFHKTFPYYFHRFTDEGEFSNGSGCGNEVATERQMVRKYIIDSVCYFAREYHIDGVRFDLMGLIDIETMNQVRDALDQIDPTLIIYGEGWTAGKSPLPLVKRAIKENMAEMPRIAAFSDDCRDAIRGSESYREQPGFVNGGIGFEESIKAAIVASIKHPQVNFDEVLYTKKPWAVQPNQTINYVSCHDGLTIYDKIVETTEGLDMTTRIKMAKMANAIVLLAQGIPFILSGEEMLRTKNGDSNSYKSPDLINQIEWLSKYDHIDLFEYYRGLIALRKAHPAFRMPSAEQIVKHLNFLETQVTNTIAFNITDKANNDSYADIVVLFNANTSEVKFKLPHFGVWNVIVDGEKAGCEVLRKFTGNDVVIPELSTLVLYSNEKLVNEVTVVEKVKPDYRKYAGYAVGAIAIYMLLKRRKNRK